jgi:pyruvate/2-oxoglutarate dehydrogenase complex dihydrolipoamide dehydrogenase (E3) component
MALLATAHAAHAQRHADPFGIASHEPAVDFAKVHQHMHGFSAAIPPVLGLIDIPYLTDETIFGLTETPDHLLVLGGGPIGIEMAQAFRRLGARVTLVERAAILPRDEPEAVTILRDALIREGMTLHEGIEVVAARQTSPRVDRVQMIPSEGDLLVL